MSSPVDRPAPPVTVAAPPSPPRPAGPVAEPPVVASPSPWFDEAYRGWSGL